MHYTTDQLIRAVYLATLNREPDPDGLAAYAAFLQGQSNRLDAFAAAFFESEEHRALMGTPNGLRDHSQHGEFAKIVRHMLSLGSRHNLIVDVGARGVERSNSYDLLSHFGWRGLLVEANPALYASIRDGFAATDFALAECAVGPAEGVLPFYLGANDDVSSLRVESAESWGDLRGVIEVPVRRLSAILEEHEVPKDFDVLSLDIEGVDVEVLNDLIGASAFRPRLVVIEVADSFGVGELADIDASPLVSAEYSLVDRTKANLMLVHRDARRG